MQITLIPIRMETALTLDVKGDALILNGETLDLSGVPEGATLPRDAVDCDWLASDVARIEGRLHLTLVLPHGANAPEQTLFPAAIVITADGPVALPPYDSEEPAA